MNRIGCFSRIFTAYSARLAASERRFQSALLEKKSSRVRRYAIYEHLLNRAWQDWNIFCRELLISSALGCKTRSGMVLPPSIAPTTVERASHYAACARSGKNIALGGVNATLRYEMTWGDLKSIQKFLNLASPANQAELTKVFGAVVGGPMHLQTVRNCCAHLNGETLAEVRALAVNYRVSTLVHPTDVANWVDPKNNDYAFIS